MRERSKARCFRQERVCRGGDDARGALDLEPKPVMDPRHGTEVGLRVGR